MNNKLRNRIEITQQQCAYAAALIVMSGFGLFLAGFFMGRIEYSNSNSALFSDNFFQPYNELTLEKKLKKFFYNKEEAQLYVSILAHRHIPAKLVVHQSKTQSGKIYESYEVYVHKDEAENNQRKISNVAVGQEANGEDSSKDERSAVIYEHTILGAHSLLKENEKIEKERKLHD